MANAELPDPRKDFYATRKKEEKMNYRTVRRGIFLSRPNRFTAYVNAEGERCVCHVKNTGRCRELLIPGATVILEASDNPMRKTAYDLVAVYKGETLINIDSQAPNRVFDEWARKTDFFGSISLIKPECTYENSRFDFYIEADDRKIFAEIKGVTLEEDGVVLFPDAPTERGIKHVTELADAVKNGYDAYVFFVIQLQNCRYFTPNRQTHPAFADALQIAETAGVRIRAMSCRVTEDSLVIDRFVPVRLV